MLKYPGRISTAVNCVKWPYWSPSVIVLIFLFAPSVYKTFGSELLNNEVEEKSNKFIISIRNDAYLCYHCVTNLTTFDELKQLIEQQQSNIHENNQMKFGRGFINMMNLINLIVVFYIYERSLFVFVIALKSLIVVFGAFFFQNPKVLIIFDSSILMISIAILLKCWCSLQCQIINPRY